jgi:hypothetical protein
VILWALVVLKNMVIVWFFGINKHKNIPTYLICCNIIVVWNEEHVSVQ